MPTFIERTDEGFDSQLQNFCSKIDTYNTLLAPANGHWHKTEMKILGIQKSLAL